MTQAELLQNIAIVATLIVLEGLLSADNALVLAVLVKHLPRHQQSRALKYGIAGAFIFRAIGVILATILIRYWQFKAAGAAYLLYLSARHFSRKTKADPETPGAQPAGPGFWKTVGLVELTDVAFSIDSIVAAVAMSQKLWVVYLGGILGIITMRFVAGFFLRVLEKFPNLEGAAYAMVGWIGIKLGCETTYQLTLSKEKIDEIIKHHETFHVIPTWAFWSIMGIIIVVSLVWPSRKGEILKHAPEIKEIEEEEGKLLSASENT